jgi:nucleoid DNA-binding protein
MPRAKKKTTTRKTAAKRKTTTRKTTRKTAVAKRKTTTKRKTTVRKTAAKTKKVARKVAPAKPAKVVVKKRTLQKLPKTAVRAAYNKSQTFSYLADMTELGKKDISNVFEALNNLIERHLTKKGGAGEFAVPGLMKLRVVRKPATRARKGINPFTGDEIMFKAKPARNVVKVRALKKLKEMDA